MNVTANSPGSPRLPRTCLNCGFLVDNSFCPRCGQTTREMRASLGSILRELFGNMFNMDSTVMRSVKPLFFDPGALTSHFMEGRRVSYVRPVRLYLISSLFFFVAFGTVLPKLTEPDPDEFNVTFDKDRLDRRNGKDKDEQTDQEKKDAEDKNTETQSKGIPLSGEELAARFEAQAEKFSALEPAERVKVFFQHLVPAASKGLFLLMPLFALFLKLLYVRRDPYYLDHLIFALHYHSFLLLFLTGLIWWNYWEDASLTVVTSLAICLVPPWYLYRAMRRVYGQSRLKTMVKWMILMSFYMLSMSILVGITSAIALLLV